MPFVLPEDAFEVTYRDEVGLISSSSFATRDGITYFNCIPRYPIFGGWNSSFEIHYKLPVSGKLHKTPNGSYIFRTKIAQLALDAFTSNFKISVMVPETAKLKYLFYNFYRILGHNYNRFGFSSSILSERSNFGIFNSQIIEVSSQKLTDDLLKDELEVENKFFMF